MYDRLIGSTTMIISIGGTTVPGSPARPEYLKASVYLPPAFVSHHPDLHRAIIDIVQHFIETIGVRTVTMWSQRACRDLGYPLTQVGNPLPNPHVDAFPSPDHNSAHYMFLGQPYRITDDPAASSDQALSQASSTDSYADAFGEDPDASTLTIIDLQQENHELREQIHILQQQISDLEEEVKVTSLRNSSQTTRAHDRIVFLEDQVQRYAPSTPVRNVTTKPAISKTPLSPLRFRSVTPSQAAPTRAQIPSGYSSPVLRSPFKRHIQPEIPTVSRTPVISRSAQPEITTISRTPVISRSPLSASHSTHPPHLDECNTDGLVYSGGPLLPHYIKLYHLDHLSTLINLISNYTPVETRIEELLKLGVQENVCEALAKAMARDKVDD